MSNGVRAWKGYECPNCSAFMENPSLEELQFHDRNMCNWKIQNLKEENKMVCKKCGRQISKGTNGYFHSNSFDEAAKFIEKNGICGNPEPVDSREED